MLAEASLDLLSALVRPGALEVVQGVARSVLMPVLQIITASSDNGQVRGRCCHGNGPLCHVPMSHP